MTTPAAYLDYGIAHLRRNEFVDAIKYFNCVIELAPNDPYAHWNRAMALLSLGNYPDGFIEHEWAWRLFSWRGFGPVGQDIDRVHILPMWNSERGKRVLLYHELGFGDAIMMARFLPV